MKNQKQIELLKKYNVNNYEFDQEENVIINGYLDLSSLTSADKDFLKGTTINGYLDLSSLTSADKDLLQKNVKQLEVGYNEEKGYCYFDGILNKVLFLSNKKGYNIYTTTNGYVAEKGNYTAHGNTIKKCIEDLEFKIIAEKLKNEPIKKDTEFTVKYYRLLTGACDLGCRSFMQNNNIPFNVIDNNTVEIKPIKAVDLLPMLEKSNAYGYEKFKSLVNF